MEAVAFNGMAAEDRHRKLLYVFSEYGVGLLWSDMSCMKAEMGLDLGAAHSQAGCGSVILALRLDSAYDPFNNTQAAIVESFDSFSRSLLRNY